MLRRRVAPKLQRHAEHVAAEAGVHVAVTTGETTALWFGVSVPLLRRWYTIECGNSYAFPYVERDAWQYLNGVATGAGVFEEPVVITQRPPLEALRSRPRLLLWRHLVHARKVSRSGGAR